MAAAGRAMMDGMADGGRGRDAEICIIGTLFIKFNWIISDK
jgi:hypothetical protein